MKQLYICLEGIDGVGKSTLADRLHAHLSGRGYRTEVLRTTKPAPAGCLTEKLVRRFPILDRSRFYRFFLFAQRSNYAASRTDPGSEIIIGDRSIITSYAYRWKKNQFLNRLHVKLVDLFERKLPSPDYVIFCYADDERIRSRLSARKQLTIDETAETARKVKQAYREILSGKPIKRLKSSKILYLDCNGSQDDVFESLTETVNKILDENKE